MFPGHYTVCAWVKKVSLLSTISYLKLNKLSILVARYVLVYSCFFLYDSFLVLTTYIACFYLFAAFNLKSLLTQVQICSSLGIVFDWDTRDMHHIHANNLKMMVLVKHNNGFSFFCLVCNLFILKSAME